MSDLLPPSPPPSTAAEAPCGMGCKCFRSGDERSLGILAERRRDSVRDATGALRAKERFLPGGVHMQSSRAAWPEAFRKACGALAGTLTVSRLSATRCWSRKLSSTSPSRTVNISSKS